MIAPLRRVRVTLDMIDRAIKVTALDVPTFEWLLEAEPSCALADTYRELQITNYSLGQDPAPHEPARPAGFVTPTLFASALHHNLRRRCPDERLEIIPGLGHLDYAPIEDRS